LIYSGQKYGQICSKVFKKYKKKQLYIPTINAYDDKNQCVGHDQTLRFDLEACLLEQI